MVKSIPLMKLIWSPSSIKSLKEIRKKIAAESTLSAEKVFNEIIHTAEQLPSNRARYPPDRFKKNNTGNHRAFEKYHYRVSYRIKETEIHILTIRHVRQMPLEY